MDEDFAANIESKKWIIYKLIHLQQKDIGHPSDFLSSSLIKSAVIDDYLEDAQDKVNSIPLNITSVIILSQ